MGFPNPSRASIVLGRAEDLSTCLEQKLEIVDVRSRRPRDDQVTGGGQQLQRGVADPAVLSVVTSHTRSSDAPAVYQPAACA